MKKSVDKLGELGMSLQSQLSCESISNVVTALNKKGFLLLTMMQIQVVEEVENQLPTT